MAGIESEYWQLRKTIEDFADRWIKHAKRCELALYIGRIISVAASVTALVVGLSTTSDAKITGIIGAIPALVTFVVTECQLRDLMAWNWEAATEAWLIFNRLAYDLGRADENMRVTEAQREWSQLLKKYNNLRIGLFGKFTGVPANQINDEIKRSA